jgi:nucleotide-binding universal stress UspA family protein
LGIVVVGVDGSDHSLIALTKAREEAAVRGDMLHVVHVTDFTPAVLHLSDGVTVHTSDLAAARRQEVWSKVDELLGEADEGVHRIDRDGYPADVLVDYCEEVGAELLVLGTRGRGRLASTLLGSTSLRALEHARCDVLVAKPREGST